MTIPTLAFATSYWDGEQLQGLARKHSALEILPLDAFCAEFMGHNWGVPAELLWYGGGPFRRVRHGRAGGRVEARRATVFGRLEDAHSPCLLAPLRRRSGQAERAGMAVPRLRLRGSRDLHPLRGPQQGVRT